FVARGIDTQQKVLPEILKRARSHKGAALVEILQNCIVYNDDAFANITAKANEAEAQIHLTHGQPLLFGKDRDRGLRLTPGGLGLEVVPAGTDGILDHDETNPLLAGLLAALEPPMPVAIGVILDLPGPSYEAEVQALETAETARPHAADLNALLRQGATWMTPA
ncbi:MAG: hypothetical protein WAS21_18945, partial [Geminicoccaceae bacterium]